MPAAQPFTLWTVDDVSAYLGVPVQTLYTWRKRRIGPPAGRVGRHLRYDPDSVRAWFEQQAAA
ncbi:helix-turn-helix domain-containing protein [Micromonospora craniellae]|uniref:DNA-binding protein n=1 Tax=Micromonospora craniellae TaxID=2294034 RepID=A0A372G5S6_9ACTN|nr:helix-turn-helix domain-containing protein [Micromonospora craniellae]QOC90237.1 helix-turn-helix domain-containing protein [Micromonospora craniellae]RFS48375.1 DNA-binding protein [Micromonospora craniellae]